MRNVTRKKEKPNNVLSIASNPRYTRPPRKIALPKGVTPENDICTFTFTANVFGLTKGDTLICQRDFDESKLTSTSLVISEDGDYRSVKPYNETLNVFAVVIAFQREVSL